VWDHNKRITNLNGVFCGVTRTTGVQKWSSNPNTVQYIYYFTLQSALPWPQATPMIFKLNLISCFQLLTCIMSNTIKITTINMFHSVLNILALRIYHQLLSWWMNINIYTISLPTEGCPKILRYGFKCVAAILFQFICIAFFFINFLLVRRKV
jgi:hypothetical protein